MSALNDSALKNKHEEGVTAKPQPEQQGQTSRQGMVLGGESFHSLVLFPILLITLNECQS